MSAIDKQKEELCQREKARLEKQYPHEDAWRAPRNIADSMGCVGYAMFALDQYRRKLDELSDDEIIRLYTKETREESLSNKSVMIENGALRDEARHGKALQGLLNRYFK